ncbi:hypothetical protein [Leptolyngbya sp. FACHB-711]|uniref:hypothetical protein n=1 Tax=unclassified Leptolyngbya TaxID=2650499 RepID=UPI0016833D7F|nr:hypothetical protein [Leptolyngbya sp. FACHB-711]MBD1853333.1 hypothetical protein [Cyanobacteria bacterium FACHB-502]MBD2024567.1 hypothetical protein [Leptolyngbya sp. FACHB-711]
MMKSLEAMAAGRRCATVGGLITGKVGAEGQGDTLPGKVTGIEEGVEADGYQVLNIIGVLPTSSFQAEEKS